MLVDELDRALLTHLIEHPRAGLRECARALGVARGTVSARFLRLRETGVITGLAPHIDPAALDYGVRAFVHVNVTQDALDDVVEALTLVPQVLQAYTVTGDADLLCAVVARDHTNYEDVIQAIVALPGVRRVRSELTLTERIPHRILPLIHNSDPSYAGQKGPGGRQVVIRHAG